MWLTIQTYVSDLSTFALCMFVVIGSIVVWAICDLMWTAAVRRHERPTRPLRLEHRSTLARTLRGEDRRPLSQRIASDVAQRRDTTVTGPWRRERKRRADSSALSDESCFQTTTLRVMPKDVA